MKNFSRLLRPVCGALALFLAGCNTTGVGSGGSAGTNVPGQPELVHAAFFMENNDEPDAAQPLPVSKVQVPVPSQPLISWYEIAGVQVVRAAHLGVGLRFQLRPQSRSTFRVRTLQNQGRRLVLDLDGMKVAAAKITKPVDDGLFIFYPEFGEKFSEQEVLERAVAIANGINSLAAQVNDGLR